MMKMYQFVEWFRATTEVQRARVLASAVNWAAAGAGAGAVPAALRFVLFWIARLHVQRFDRQAHTEISWTAHAVLVSSSE
jgi:hypothetical protein